MAYIQDSNQAFLDFDFDFSYYMVTLLVSLQTMSNPTKEEDLAVPEQEPMDWLTLQMTLAIFNSFYDQA